VTFATPRLYRGQDAGQRSAERRLRFLAAGLELMGTQGVQATTVRAVIAEAGLAPRYFYDLFTDLADLQVAVLNELLAEVERVGLESLRDAPKRPRARTRAVLSAFVDLLLDDPRKGRLLLLESLSSPAMGARRMDETVRFADMLAAHSGAWIGDPAGDPAVHVRTHYVVNGFVGTLAAVLADRIQIDRTDLVDRLTDLFLAAGRTQNRARR